MIYIKVDTYKVIINNNFLLNIIILIIIIYINILLIYNLINIHVYKIEI